MQRGVTTKHDSSFWCIYNVNKVNYSRGKWRWLLSHKLSFHVCVYVYTHLSICLRWLSVSAWMASLSVSLSCSLAICSRSWKQHTTSNKSVRILSMKSVRCNTVCVRPDLYPESEPAELLFDLRIELHESWLRSRAIPDVLQAKHTQLDLNPTGAVHSEEQFTVSYIYVVWLWTMFKCREVLKS